MTTVILAEKPDQARAYAAAFSKYSEKHGYIEIEDNRFFKGKALLTWGYGHLVELQEPDQYRDDWGVWSLDNLPILPEKFKFRVDPKKRKQFNIVKKILNQASEIIVATDADREGENIARSIIYLAGAFDKPTKRLWINSLASEEIIRGFSNLKNGNDFLGLYQEAQTRQLADWIVGINASRLYSLLLQKKGIRESFSVGRVQTPTLFLIYQRQKEIENFKPQKFYELLAEVKTQNGTFLAKHTDKFSSKEVVDQLLSRHNIQKNDLGIISKVDKQLKKQKAPKLHSLSSLQEKANRLWKYSPKIVLDTVQSLYEKKLLSYPRSDCHFITEAEFNYLSANIAHYQSLLHFEIAYPEARKGYVDSSKVQEHYSIIPTKKKLSQNEIDALETKERNIYMEVLTNTIAMFAPDYEFEETKVEVDIKGLLFKSTGKIDKVQGWKALFKEQPDDEREVTTENKLPFVSQGENIAALIDSKEGVTTPPKAFSEGQLIKAMKTAGYKGSQALEDEEVRSVLKENEGIGTEATRADTIETLKQKSYIEVKKNKVVITNKGIILSEAVAGTLLSSPEMTAKWEIYLKKIGQLKGNQETFLKNIEKFIKHLMLEAPKQLDSEHITLTVHNAKKAAVIGQCPACKKSVLDKGKFYGCEGYTNGCLFTLPKTYLSKNISVSNIKKLLETKKSNLIKGFKSRNKAGRAFDAKLILNDKNELKMEFPKKTIKNEEGCRND